MYPLFSFHVIEFAVSSASTPDAMLRTTFVLIGLSLQTCHVAQCLTASIRQEKRMAFNQTKEFFIFIIKWTYIAPDRGAVGSHIYIYNALHKTSQGLISMINWNFHFYYFFFFWKYRINNPNIYFIFLNFFVLFFFVAIIFFFFSMAGIHFNADQLLWLWDWFYVWYANIHYKNS